MRSRGWHPFYILRRPPPVHKVLYCPCRTSLPPFLPARPLQAKWLTRLVMSFIMVLVSLFAFFIAGTSAQKQTAVTLWQFGQGRLLQADVTLPLEPLGTVSDGSATTYLYRALNNNFVTTTNAAGITTQTIPKPTPRTVVASASGWLEPSFGVSCGLVDSTFGQCFLGTNTVPANSGKPTPEVILIADPTSGLSSQSIPTSSSHSSSHHSNHTPPVGAIVALVLAGCVVLSLGVAIFILLRRRRVQQAEFEQTAARSYDPDNIGDFPQPQAPFAVYTAGPQAERGYGTKGHKREYSRGSEPESLVASELPTSDLVRMLVQRVNDEQRGLEAPPPAYPMTPHP
ncbi:hypothetical protein MSAN_02263600 [Mycena sanguinolenta]|uniref:Transmembrane protein n=1 Tax=Mycena sanguinolenta TaxID=230812 RepID=A0A8H7CHA3_9AGAR|nr:hypothetical protein MSAN_02263600 [Mycena sanguinolenta]